MPYQSAANASLVAETLGPIAFEAQSPLNYLRTLTGPAAQAGDLGTPQQHAQAFAGQELRGEQSEPDHGNLLQFSKDQ